jgi:hypothetical protein
MRGQFFINSIASTVDGSNPCLRKDAGDGCYQAVSLITLNKSIHQVINGQTNKIVCRFCLPYYFRWSSVFKQNRMCLNVIASPFWRGDFIVEKGGLHLSCGNFKRTPNILNIPQYLLHTRNPLTELIQHIHPRNPVAARALKTAAVDHLMKMAFIIRERAEFSAFHPCVINPGRRGYNHECGSDLLGR